MRDDGIGLKRGSPRLHILTSIRGRVGVPGGTENDSMELRQVSCPGKEVFCDYLHHSESLFS